VKIHRGNVMKKMGAKTLADRFNPSCGGGDKHGLTSSLTSGQIADLVAYMETL